MEDRVEKAVRLFKEGYNCSQAVAAAFCDLYDIDEEVVLRMACSFGGGMGRMREVCGAVSGMAIIAGLENGITHGKDVKGKKENYDLVVSMADEFKKANGSIICRELLGLDKRDEHIDTTPAVRSDKYYKKRPCVELVRQCAEIIEDTIIKKSNKINIKADFVKVESPEHVIKINEMADEIWEYSYADVLSSEQIEYMIDRYQTNSVITKKMVNEGYEYFLVNNGKSVIGYTSYLVQEDLKQVIISDLYLRPNYLEKDYIKAILNQVVNSVKDKGVNKVLVNTNKIDKTYIEVYKKQGYEKVSEYTEEFGNGYTLDKCIFEKKSIVGENEPFVINMVHSTEVEV